MEVFVIGGVCFRRFHCNTDLCCANLMANFCWYLSLNLNNLYMNTELLSHLHLNIKSFNTFTSQACARICMYILAKVIVHFCVNVYPAGPNTSSDEGSGGND